MNKNTTKNILLTFLPILVMALFIIFIFSLPSTYGIFKWNQYYKNLLLKICILPIFISLFGLFALIFKSKKIINKIFSLISTVLNIIFIIIIIAIVFYIFYNSNPSFAQIEPKIILLDTTGSYGIADIGIYFSTSNKEIAQCDYYTESNKENITSIKDEKKSLDHIFIIKDLLPDSIYYFKLSNGKTYKYKTPKTEISENSPFSFVVSSDPHFGRKESRNDITKRIIDLAQQSQDNAFFAILGDFVESGYSKSDWQIASKFLSENFYSIPIIPVMGNHDAFVGGHRFYKTIFSPVKTVNTKSDFYKHYKYDFNGKKVHIINLSLLWGVEDFSLKQKNFLINKLSKTSKDDIVIILTHAFIYASGYNEEGGIPWYDNISAIKTLEPIFKKYDVDLVLSGHNHTMELIENDSIYYAIIGSFGGLPDPEKTFTSKGSIWYTSGKYGYAKISLFAEYFLIKFFDENNKILFENMCKY